MNFYGRMPVGSVVLSPYPPALTGLELMFIRLTGSNSGLFRAPGSSVSPVGKGGKKGKEGKMNRKGKEGRKKE